MADTTQIEIPPAVATAPWGFHAIFDCSDVELAKIQDIENIKNWISTLQTKLNTAAVGSLSHTNSGLVGKNGHSVYQLFTHGSITAHFLNDEKQIYIDLFFWKMFNPKEILDTISPAFGASTDVKTVLMPRNASVPAQTAPV